MPVFTYRFELDHPADEVTAWLERSGSTQRLTPAWSPVLFRGPGEIGRPFRVRSRDRRVERLGDGRSAVVESVAWEGPLESLDAVSNDWVGRSLERLLSFGARRLAGDLGLHRRYGSGAGRTVAVTGSSGMIGSALRFLLEAGGYRVVRVSRSPSRGPDEVEWDPHAGRLNGASLEGVHAVVHLAGESIAGVRWTRAKREAILRSRWEGTLLLCRVLADLGHSPEVLVSGSAVGYYGNRGEERLTERSASGDGFLADVCRRWEEATHVARAIGIRTVHLRTGVVLSPAGGMLGTVLLPFGLGLGGRVGSGRQYLSWIDLDDLTGLILHAIREVVVRGPMNGTAPHPVTNAAFTDVLGRVLGRPTLLPAPALAVRALLGDMGEELLLWGQRAVPQTALDTGYAFQFTDLEDSLAHQLGRAAA
jgi:uncharacterized protein (TIGR01777 family)